MRTGSGEGGEDGKERDERRGPHDGLLGRVDVVQVVR